MDSLSLFRYHIVSGCNSDGGPKQFMSEHRRSGGSKFDSIIAILCACKYERKKKIKEWKIEIDLVPTQGKWILIDLHEKRVKE